MEMSTVVEEPVAEAEVAEDLSAALNGRPEKMFRHSIWVHVGEDADVCPQVVENETRPGLGCENEEHFHAYCRLPNQFQHRDIVEKSTAAKARRIRLLNDPESDAHEVFEATLRQIRHSEDREIVIEELLTFGWQEDYLEALQRVGEDDEFESIQQDRQELQRLLELSEDNRPEDALDSLQRHIGRYVEATKTELENVQKPRRQSLEGLDYEALIADLRERRIGADADEEYHHTFSQWEWLVGTREPDKRTPKFKRIEEMRDAAPEVIEVLRQTFQELRVGLQRGTAGNS